MRISTILFLALFAGIFGSFHRSQQVHRAQEAAFQATERATSAATRSMEAELGQISRRLRNSDRSVRGLEQAARRLQDLLRHSDHSSSSKASVAARNSTQREVEAQLAEVMAGRQHLLDEKEGLIGRQAVLQARLEMARAGLLPAEDEWGIDDPLVGKPSPLEALTDSSGQTTRTTVLVVR